MPLKPQPLSYYRRITESHPCRWLSQNDTVVWGTWGRGV